MVGENSTPSDRAVAAQCDLLALVFGLPFGDDLYHDISIPGRHIAFLFLGLMIAAFGHMWPRIKGAVPKRIADTVALAALDFRLWVVLLLAIFVVLIAPEIYQRAVESGPTAEQIAKAVVHEMPTNNAATSSTPTAPGPFLFAYKLPYIQSPADRAKFGYTMWRFTVGFISDKRLIGANPRIVYAERRIADKWERLIPSNEEDKIGWDDYANAFKSKDIAANNEQQIVMFIYGTGLDMFNERTDGELKRYKDMKPGEYRFIVRVDAENIGNDETIGIVHLWWYGDPETIRITSERYSSNNTK